MKVIAKQVSPKPSNASLGEILPLWINDSGYWEIATQEMFPNNGKVFIVFGYEQAIMNRYEQPDLFLVEVNDTSNMPSIGEDGSWHISNGDNVKDLNKHMGCRVIVKSVDLNHKILGVRDKYPIRNYVFINSKNTNIVYGPFDNKSQYSDDGINVSFIAPNPSDLDLSSDYKDCVFSFELDDNFYKHTVDSFGSLYVLDAIALLKDENVKKEVCYYGDVKELLDWGKNRLESIDVSVINKIYKNLSTFNVSNRIEEIRINKLKEILDFQKAWATQNLYKFVSYYLEFSEQGKETLNEYFKKNSTDLQEKYNKQIVELSQEVETKKLELDGLYKNDKIANLEEAEKTFIDEFLENKGFRESYVKIVTYQKLIDRLEAKIELMEEDGEKKINKLNNEISERQKQNEDLKSTFEAIKKEFNNENKVRENLIRAKSYIDLLNGVTPDDESTTSSLIEKYITNVELVDQSPNHKDYFLNIQENIKKIGRDMSYNDLVNIMLLINNNFFTVIAGLPGVGKTSLITKLAEAAGLKDRFLSVPVARGWTSSRDLIGYYNPLSNKFQPSKTKLFTALATCHNNLKDNIDVPYWVMLDEANLSPVEYYWSDFMAHCDLDSNRILNISGNNQHDELNIGLGLRFIGTINYDHTTEILSPRLLDRVAVLVLKEPDMLIDVNMSESINLTNNYYSVQQLQSIFNPSNLSFTLTTDEQNLFTQIKEILGSDAGMPILISPRKQIDVIKYCTLARQLFDKEGSQFEPLDYAINQYVLPLLNGRGEDFAKKINSLLSVARGTLPNTTATLDKIIKYGEANYQTYRFLS